ncbi:MAG: hypothetical protein ACRD28_08840, partial [Acidobacteriaceae bacterium]
MIRSKPHQLCWISLAVIALAVAIGSAPKAARAQQAAGHPATSTRPIYRTYTQRQPPARPVRPMQLAYPRAMPIRRPVIRQFPRPTQARTYVAPRTFTPRSIVPPKYAQSGFRQAGLRDTPSQPTGKWRGLGPRGYFNSYLFGGSFVSDFGYWVPSANYQMLPLGFGLWPACDSAAIPGRFWTIGPCSGIGAYQWVASPAENVYPPQPYFQTPLEIIEEPQPAAPLSTQKSPAEPAEKPNMIVSLTNGQNAE